jgi:hypothetical protein
MTPNIILNDAMGKDAVASRFGRKRGVVIVFIILFSDDALASHSFWRELSPSPPKFVTEAPILN